MCVVRMLHVGVCRVVRVVLLLSQSVLGGEGTPPFLLGRGPSSKSPPASTPPLRAAWAGLGEGGHRARAITPPPRREPAPAPRAWGGLENGRWSGALVLLCPGPWF